ncbi:MAG TPA: YoaK family protein [Phycisphaerae bacterium]|nr:YoaK family protein [Phycisphaerae bacterium]
MTAQGTMFNTNWLLPIVLGTTAGAVDVIIFLTLGGLFTAHITGNIIILAAHYITGGFSQIGPVLSVPVFIAVLATVTLVSGKLERTGHFPRRALLILQAVLLMGCLIFGAAFGPFANVDRPMAVFVGMLGVAAMATQNALVRLALPGAPTTAVMTTNITQLTIDLVTLAGGWGQAGEVARARRRSVMTFASVIGFAVGCAAGAILEVRFGLWALALPAILAALAIPLGERWGNGQNSHADSTNG